MTEFSAKAGNEGYAACDDDGGLYCQERPSTAFLDSQKQPGIPLPGCFGMYAAQTT